MWGHTCVLTHTHTTRRAAGLLDLHYEPVRERGGGGRADPAVRGQGHCDPPAPHPQPATHTCCGRSAGGSIPPAPLTGLQPQLHHRATRHTIVQVAVVDASALLPKMRRCPGLLTWQVRDPSSESTDGTGGWYATRAEVPVSATRPFTQRPPPRCCCCPLSLHPPPTALLLLPIVPAPATNRGALS